MATYKFTKSIGGPVTKDKVKTWLKRFRDKHPAKDTVTARFIGSDILSKILAQEGCVGVRVYFGYDERDQIEIFFIGTDENGNDMVPDETAARDGGKYTMADSTMPCPPYCSATTF
jgi:hypothetical protein